MNTRSRLLSGLIAILLLLTACTPSAPPVPTSTATPVPTMTHTPTLTPTLTPTATPVPVNDPIIDDAVTISQENIDFILRVADLWPAGQVVLSGSFYDEKSIVLVTAEEYGWFSSYDREIRGPAFLTSQPQVMLWDIQTNTQRELFTATVPNEIPDSPKYSRVAVSPDRKKIALMANNRFIIGELQDDADGNLMFTSTEIDISDLEEDQAIISAVFSHNSQLLAIVGWYSGMMIWDVDANQEVAVRSPFCGETAVGASFSPDDQFIVAPCGRVISRWDLNLTEKDAFGEWSALVFAANPDQSLLAAVDYEALSIWNVASGERKSAMTGALDNIRQLFFSHDGNLLVSIEDSGTVSVWEVHSGKNLVVLDASADFAEFSPDDKFLLTGNYREGGTLWSVQTSAMQAERSGIQVIVSGQGLSLDGWKEVVPSAWLTPKLTLPRHQVRITGSWESAGRACSYTNNGFLRFERAVVRVEIVDQERNSVVSQNEFRGGIPPGAQGQCPATYIFTNTQTVVKRGTEPSIEEFQAWVMKALAQWGYK